MKRRSNAGPQPRVRPQMNTETRRHGERVAYHRRPKYRDELVDEETLNQAAEDGGVLSDYAEDSTEPDEPEKPARGGRSR